MGNCIIIQNKIMPKGEEVIKHKGSMKVNQVLGGQTYDSVPLRETETKGGDKVVRIKLVISKQELEVMLRKGGVSAGDLASRMQKESSDEAVVIEEDSRSCGRWKPVLDSIPESN